MATTIKAVRAQIQLGDIAIDVYQLPNGEYRLSGRNVTDAVGEAANSLLRVMGVKTLKSLPGAGLECYKVSSGKEGTPFYPVAIADASLYWAKCSQNGNQKAFAIVVACMTEAIERRADEAFGVNRTEPERNQRMKSLIDCILNDSKTWSMHFKPQWRQEACRVTGYRWHPSRPMAQFISTYIYKALPKDVYDKALPKDVYDRLMELNADRKARHHQFFDNLADEVILKEHIQQVGGLLRVSKNKAHFKQLFADAFGDGIQTDILFGEDSDTNAA